QQDRDGSKGVRVGGGNVQVAVTVEIACDGEVRTERPGTIGREGDRQRLIGWRGRAERRGQGVVARTHPDPRDLDEVRAGQEVLVNQVVPVGGRLAVALDQQLAVRSEQAQARVQ